MLPALHIVLICSTTLSFDQVQIKHDQSQVFSPDSHVTIGTMHQKQDAVNVLWVGIRLDLWSYWDSSKLVGRPWRDQHGI